MSEQAYFKYQVRFHPAALTEYERLDNSVAEIVDKKLSDLEKRAEVIGKALSGNLSGYREIKLRDAGIRVIYETLHDEGSNHGVVYILAIQKREKKQAFEMAEQRINKR